MKTVHFHFTMIGYALLTYGVAYADPSSAVAAQPSVRIPNMAVSDHLLGSSPPAGAARGGPVGNKPANYRVVSLPSTALPNGSSSKNMRGQNSGPVVIGGLVNSAKSTVAINGSSLNRKR
jgi:hypothetical protein